MVKLIENKLFIEAQKCIDKLNLKNGKYIPDEWTPDNHADYDVGFIHGVRYAIRLIEDEMGED